MMNKFVIIFLILTYIGIVGGVAYSQANTAAHEYTQLKDILFNNLEF